MAIKKYTKPSIKEKKVKVNEFIVSGRTIDSFASLPNLLAQATYCTSCTVVSQCNCTNCLLGEVKILMKDHSMKKVMDLEIGDKVIAFDEDNDKTRIRRVKKIIAHYDYLVDYMIINNSIKVTLDHVVYVNGEWKKAVNLKVGDVLMNSLKGQIEIINIKNFEEVNTTYNFETDGEEHNYFAENLLVRDACNMENFLKIHSSNLKNKFSNYSSFIEV